MKTALGTNKNSNLRVHVSHRTLSAFFDSIKEKKLSPLDFTVWQLMLTVAWTDGESTNPCMKNCKTIANELRLSEKSIRRSLKRLETSGFIVPVYRLKKRIGKKTKEFKTDSLKKATFLWDKKGWSWMNCHYTIPPHLRAGTFVKKSVH